MDHQKKLILLALMCLLAAPISAMAHARLVKSSPASGAELDRSPAKLDFWFSELLDKGFNNVVVYPARDVNLKKHTDDNFAMGDPQLDAADQTHMSVSLKPLPPGEYIVDWQVLSRDGHTAPGRFRFKVRAAK